MEKEQTNKSLRSVVNRATNAISSCIEEINAVNSEIEKLKSQLEVLASARAKLEEQVIIQTKELENTLSKSSHDDELKHSSPLDIEEQTLGERNFHIEGKPIILGINNLLVKNEESLYDAKVFFNKECPYCGVSLYGGSVRDKIEVDHFIPVSRGGQDLPWNLLPVCKTCNRKKRDKMPFEFLDEERYLKCSTYLNEVRTKYYENGIASYIDTKNIFSLIIENIDYIKSNYQHKFINHLVQITAPELLAKSKEWEEEQPCEYDYNQKSPYTDYTVDFLKKNWNLGKKLEKSKEIYWRSLFLYQEYCNWCQKVEVNPVSHIQFSHVVKNYIPKFRRTKSNVGAHYFGMALPE